MSWSRTIRYQIDKVVEVECINYSVRIATYLARVTAARAKGRIRATSARFNCYEDAGS